MSDLIDRQKAKDAIDMALDHIDHVPSWVYDNLLNALNEVPSVKPTHPTPSNTLGALDCIERRLVSYKLTDLINEFEEILSHIREREENDSVCGLCEYDGAYMGQSGDWCNECPGFDKADCFKLKDKYKKEWLELMNTLPSVQPERTCVNCGRTANNGGWYADGGTRCPIEEHYALPKDGYCHLWEKRNVTDDDYPERRTDE